MVSWTAAVQQFLQHHATLVLFVCICLGYLIGGIRFGKFRLGGVCGTLLVALVLGQANVVVAPGASQVAFALFIFSLGYLAGPQFVASFSRHDVRLVVFPAVSVVVVTLLVVGATVLLGLGPGTAAGLFAGGTSQSAALGTASEALDHLGLAPSTLAAEQTDLASAYSLSYLCALVTIVAFSTQIAPALMRVDLAAGADLVGVGVAGSRARLGTVQPVIGADELGRAIDRSVHADWAYLAAGIVVGMLIGLLDLQWGPFAMTIGTGGGVLLAGLLFGWLRLRLATVGAYNPVAAEVIKDLGLTIFIGVTGLTGAPRLASMLDEFGPSLPIAALLVCLVPAAISLLVARRLLRLPPTLALGAVVGQQCSTPALTLLQQRAGNNTPLITFVKVYALSNVILPLLAPMIIGITVALQR